MKQEKRDHIAKIKLR